MNGISALFSLGILCVVVLGEPWDNLRTTWAAVPLFSGFYSQPRTLKEASSEGYRWIKMSSCNDPDDPASKMFPGERYARSKEDDDIVLIFDRNGFIAGMQSIVNVKKTSNEEFYKFSEQPAYQEGKFFDEDVFYVTVYFVDPEIICGDGRIQREFDRDGTGDRLLIQTGPTPANVIEAPLTEKEAGQKGNLWFRHRCMINMGVHYLQDFGRDDECRSSFPVQLVYNSGKLNAFVFQHVADLKGERWEHPGRVAIDGILKNAPDCLYELADEPGLSTMHVYLGAYRTFCIDNLDILG